MNVRQLVKSAMVAAFTFPTARRSGVAFPILTYHAVTPEETPISVTPEFFRRQIEFLQVAGYRTITFAETVKALRQGNLPTERAVCLTFDDAYRNVAENAIPHLREAGFTATIFVPTHYVAGSLRFYEEAGPGGWGVLDWDELRGLAEAGIEIASHTRRHPHLPELEPAALRDELEGSRLLIEEKVGRPVTTLCYPFGDYDDRICDASRQAGYAGACTIEFGACTPEHDPFRIPRIGTSPLATLYQFKAGLQGAFEAYMRARGRAAPLPARR